MGCRGETEPHPDKKEEDPSLARRAKVLAPLFVWFGVLSMREFSSSWGRCAGLFVVVFAALSSVGGCSYSYVYDVRGVILDASDGTPISDVAVALQSTIGIRVTTPEPCMTNADGTFHYSFKTYLPHRGLADSDAPRWLLLFKKAEFADQTVDITPVRKSEKNNLVSVVAYLKPLQQNQ